MKFDYDVQGKRKLDSEMSPLISDYIEKNGCFPKKIFLSRKKFIEFEAVFPTKLNRHFEYDNIPMEYDDDQSEDYRLI